MGPMVVGEQQGVQTARNLLEAFGPAGNLPEGRGRPLHRNRVAPGFVPARRLLVASKTLRGATVDACRMTDMMIPAVLRRFRPFGFVVNIP